MALKINAMHRPKSLLQILFVSIFLIFINACHRNFYQIAVPKPKGSNYSADQVEPSIAASPKNSKHLVAGSVLNGFYSSKNRGKSWTASLMNSPHGVNGDPVVLADNFGNYFYFHLANSGKDHYLDRIVCQRTTSLDQAMTTVGHTEVNGKVHDKHWVCSDPNTGTLHMAWTQFDKYNSRDPLDSTIIVYSNSKDFGKTWSTPKRISALSGNCLDDSGTIEGVSICLGLQGEVFVSYCLNSKIFLNKSEDGGATWLPKEIEIAEQIGGWNFQVPGVYRVNGFPSLTLDRSNSKYKGRLYICWTDQRLGSDNTEVFLSFSDDLGETWSAPQSIFQDRNHQFFSTLSLDQSTGNLAVIFYSQINPDTFETRLVLLTSDDGSATFKNEEILTDTFRTYPKIFFGDYIGLDYKNLWIHMLWPEIANGQIVLKYGRIKK